MGDKINTKSLGYSHQKRTIRTVSTTKWERPIPGLKSYWDKICDDLEQRKEHVSEFPNSFPPSPDLITDPNVTPISRESISSKLNNLVEPIVKISPPTPMRMMTATSRLIVSNKKSLNEYENSRETDFNNQAQSNLSDSSSTDNVNGRKDAKLYDVSLCMTEMLKNSNAQTKKSCHIHKNAPPLKIFDDNLKKFLPKKKTTLKVNGANVQPMFPPTVIDFSKFHQSKSCPFRSQPVSEELMKLGVSSTENRNRVSRSFKKSETEVFDEKKAKRSNEHFLKVPESPYVTLRSNSRFQGSDEKSKILESNLNQMFNIPKLNDLGIDENLIKSNEAGSDKYGDECADFPNSRELDASNLETTNLISTYSSPSNENVIPKVTENFKPSSNQFINLPRLSEETVMGSDCSNNANGKGVSKDKIGSEKLQDKRRKDFLKVPKLGAISSYPSFSKLTSSNNLEIEENQKPVVSVSTVEIENPGQTIESNKRDFLKVPKLSMMSSYPSFNSLIPESLDSDDNTTGVSELNPKRPANETSTQNTSISADERNLNYRESSDLVTSPDKNFSSRNNSLQSEIPAKRRKSLKDSVRYAYRALKFLTPNKTLDFQPQSYNPPHKTGSSSSSSESSRASKYSKFEPAIKLLTYEDVSKCRPVRSVSSSSYGSVRSRLRQSASQYLGFDYVLLSSKAKLDTSLTTIPSLTRSTSGPTLDFQEPIYDMPSEKVLSKLPKMSIFPRRKYDKCLACLHKAFDEPIEPLRELPLTTLNAFSKESIEMLSESESSSISIPDVKHFARSESDYEDNFTNVLRNAKKSPLFDKMNGKLSKGVLRGNLELYRSRQPLARTSEDSQSLKSDSRIENSRKNLSAKYSTATNTHSKPVSVSSEHSKASSLSGHSSESEEPQVQIKQAASTTECFVSPYAPLHWAPSLEPLKSLKYRKPVSMHGRAVSITKTEEDSTSDDNANDYRSTRKETKLKASDKVQDSLNGVEPSKSATKSAEKSNLTKQPSIMAKIISSQLSTVASLTKIQSKVDLLSGDSKRENETTSVSDVDSEILGKNTKESEISKAAILDAVAVEESSTKSPLSKIVEQLIENESKRKGDDDENLEADKRSSLDERISVSRESKEHEQHFDEPRDMVEETCGIYSNKKVTEVLEKCIEENKTPFQMLEALNVVATNNDPFISKETISIPEIARSARIAENLIKLLINSKKYLNPKTFSPHLEFSSSQTPLCNPRQLRRVLPTKTYNLVARILGMPEKPADKSDDQKQDFTSGHKIKDPFKLGQTGYRVQNADSCDMIVHPPSYRGGRRSAVDDEDFEYPQQSPYALFMNKPRRKAITWRPLTDRDMLGYDPEATLNMRATRVTNKICEDFCHWLRGLGGAHGEDIDEEVLRDMFQIEFTAEACRTMQVLVKEIPMVPMAVALARNTPGAGELALTRRHLIRDSRAENMPKKIIGFGSMLPRKYRFIPPKNHVDKKWLQCESVPRDLETMEAVWKGITHLDSVKGFLAWLKAHPGVKPPKILTEAYAQKEALVRQSSAEEAGGHIELEMDQIKSLKVADVE